MSNEKTLVLDSIIGCGRFQILLYLCSQWVIFAQAWNLLGIVFNKTRPTWTCWDNATSETSQELAPDLDQCAIRANCKNLTYSYEYYSFVTEWELVCEKEHLAFVIMSIQMAGVLAGAPVFGQISDTFGRKWPLLLEVSGIIVTGIASAASPSWEVYSVCIFFVGFFAGGSINTGAVLMLELLSQKHRLWVPSAAGWPMAFMFLSLIAYLSKEWRTFVVAINVLSIPALVFILLVGESPRWLMGAGKINQAVKGLRRVSKINRANVTEYEWNVITDSKSQSGDSSGKSTKKYSYWHLFSTRKMALHTVVLSITYFCLSSISFGLTFSLDKLSGSIFLNFFYMSCLRWTGDKLTIVADLFVRKYGRRVGVIVPASIISLASTTVSVLFVAAPTFHALPTILRVLLLFSAAMCSSMWISMGLACNELFPTPIRSMAVAFSSIFNRLGALVMPQILYMALFWKPSPYVAFALLSFLCALLYFLFIPETKGLPLPQTMPEKARSRLASSIEQGQPMHMETNGAEVLTPLALQQTEV